MIRLALIIGVLAAPATAQTALGERPGRWLSVPRASAAPGTTDRERPVIAAARPSIVAPAPEPQPVPRPEVLGGEAPDIALEVIEAPAPAGPLPSIAALPGPRPAPRPGSLADAPEPAEPDTDLVGIAAPVIEMTARPDDLPDIALPDTVSTARSPVLPVAVARPEADAAPVLPRPVAPPQALMEIGLPLPVRNGGGSAVLVSEGRSAPAPLPRLVFAAMPMPDRYPYSAMAPDLLPAGPQSLDRAAPPPAPDMERMAGVLLTPPAALSLPSTPPEPPARPVRDTVPGNPEAPVPLPRPDPRALARMIADAEICWSFARLSPDARRVRLSVDVALDETNMPARPAIRLSGFSGALSGAAEESYRAAHAALTGCAAATSSPPVTRRATLVFDRDGVHLR